MTDRRMALAGGLVLLAMPLLAAAQTVSEVRFAPGDYGAMIRGTVTGDEYLDYRLRARAEQRLFAEMTSDGIHEHGAPNFDILPPGKGDVPLFDGSPDGTELLPLTLPEDGTYTIRVYQLGEGRDSGRAAPFVLKLEIQ